MSKSENEFTWPNYKHDHPEGESCRACLVNMAAVEANAARQGAETLATARRVGSMYQNRAKDLAAVLLDARGLVRGVDADLDRRIDAALSEAGFLDRDRR